MKLFCDEHRNTAPLSSLVTVYVVLTWMHFVQISVLFVVVLDTYTNSDVLFLNNFQILTVPCGLPTSALHIKLIERFSSSSFGNNRNFSGSLALAKTIKGIRSDKQALVFKG